MKERWGEEERCLDVKKNQLRWVGISGSLLGLISTLIAHFPMKKAKAKAKKIKKSTLNQLVCFQLIYCPSFSPLSKVVVHFKIDGVAKWGGVP